MKQLWTAYCSEYDVTQERDRDAAREVADKMKDSVKDNIERQLNEYDSLKSARSSSRPVTRNRRREKFWTISRPNSTGWPNSKAEHGWARTIRSPSSPSIMALTSTNP